VLRGSFARYAGQLGNYMAGQDSPLGSTAMLEFPWVDSNGDGIVQKSEVITSGGPTAFGGVDPANPTALSSPNKINPDLVANHDLEFIAGIDHELAPNLAVGLAYTHKHSKDYAWYPYIGVSASDYVATAPVTANGSTASPEERS
jgi:hypothetical protein